MAVIRNENDELREYVIGNIDRAIGEGWIKVYYQPVARTLTGEICGMEALARWVDPVYGVLPPDRFINALEASEQIHKLDSYMIRRICMGYADALKKEERFVTVSFNLSRLDFRLTDIHGVIEEALKEYKVPKDAIRVEITESMMESNEERMREVIDRFWEDSIRVWMDDFGSGYSSLNVLKDYHFETLKIDMAFLRHFDMRSQEIVKSVVDMAKRIGVHTLAEGVETKEQFEFLKNIGCEKAQGYYFGKPLPYEECLASLKEKGYELENPFKRKYYHDIGRVNVLSATPLLSVKDNSTDSSRREQQVPIAFVELSGTRIRYLFANESYRSTLRNIGKGSLEDAEREFRDGASPVGQKFISLMQKAKETGETVTADFVEGDNCCYAHVRAIAEYPGGSAFLCILQNLSEDTRLSQRFLLTEHLHGLCSIYDRIELVDLKSGYSKNLHAAAQTRHSYNILPAVEELRDYAQNEIYLDDRKRYLRFSDLSTIEDRIRESPTNYVSEAFRTRTRDGSYVWALYSFLFSGDPRERLVLSCVRRMAPNAAALAQGRTYDFNTAEHYEGEVTPEMLWENYIAYSDTAYFWKDRNRRFLGVNRKFLEYYGLESDEELIGKTDEEMGWHVSPQQFKTDEEGILERGEQTFLVPGTCICRGQLRDIMASKIPLYHDGEIIGLMGYFIDVTDQKLRNLQVEQLTLTDPRTGTLNFLGLVESVLRYQESFALEKRDFAIAVFDIEHFRRFNDNFGVEYGNKLLLAVGERVRSVVGVTGIAGRLNSDHFMVVKQVENREEMSDLCEAVCNCVSKIEEIDGMPVTVYFRYGFAVYSETKDLQQMFLEAEKTASRK